MTHINLNSIIGDYKIADKRVVVVEKHHEVLPIWWTLRMVNPVLITFDFHTDTQEPLKEYGKRKAKEKYGENHTDCSLLYARKIAEEVLATINPDSHSSINQLAGLLSNDEQIKTACHFGIISHYQTITPGDSQLCLGADGNICEEQKVRLDQVMEDDHLNQMDILKPNGPFILDIDCDYFQTEKSFHPDSCGVFEGLIRDCEMITIALEPAYCTISPIVIMQRFLCPIIRRVLT